MSQISPITLEIVVILLGVFLVVLESFRSNLTVAAARTKNGAWRSVMDNFREEMFSDTIAVIGITVLSLVLIASFSPDLGDMGSQFYAIDIVAISFKQFALITTIVVLFMARDYAPVMEKYVNNVKSQAGLGEFYAIPIFTCAGLMFMASAKDLIMMFVSIELVTMSFYILVTFMRRNVGSLEAGVKYLIIGALSTGFFVYGLTWVFGATGQTNFDAIKAAIPTLGSSTPALLFGYALIVVALGFKVAAVPFQIWVPDVYQGAPTPITAFLSVGSKAAGFVVLMRVAETFQGFPPEMTHNVWLLFVILAAATLIYGNLGAIPQTNVKRLLAYSSIAHAGYLLIGIACFYAEGTGRGIGPIISFYLWAYLAMTLLVFLIVTVVARETGGDDLRNFHGLVKRSPFLGGSLIVGMLSLAGIPFTAGFLGKMYIFMAAIERHQVALCVVGVMSVAAGFYYYLKVVKVVCLEEPESTAKLHVGLATRVVITLLVIAIVVFGVYSPLR